MQTKIHTLIIEDAKDDRDNLVQRITKYEIKYNVKFENFFQDSPDWGNINTLEKAFDEVKKNWNKIDLIFLDLSFYIFEERRESKDAGIRFVKGIGEYAETKGINIPFSIIILTANKDIEKSFFKLPAKHIIKDYAVKADEEDLNQALESFISGFLEKRYPLIDQMKKLSPRIVSIKSFEDWGELTFIIKPEQILFVKGEGGFHHWYLTCKAQRSFTDLLKKESALEQLRSNPEFQKLNNKLNEFKKNTNSNYLDEKDKNKINSIKVEIKKFKESFFRENKNNFKPASFLRFSGGIGAFEKIVDQENLQQFRRIHAGYIINLDYLSYVNLYEKEYFLIDDTVSGEEPQISIVPFIRANKSP